MNMDGFVISQDRFWRCTLTDPPALGETVRVLNSDGVDIGKATWTSRSHLYFYGWAPLDKVPPHIKRRILERYPVETAPTMTSYEWLNQTQYRGITLLDPDGWDRSSPQAFNRAMHEQIDEREFMERMRRSTCSGLAPMRKLPIYTEIDPPKNMEAV